jgi:outer membrane lipoprotein carrier protein
MDSGKVVSLIAMLLLLASSPEAIERYYNAAKTLEARFEQKYLAGGRERTESGTLTLRKPGRMRWDYESGKVFLTDAKRIWFYQPAANRAEYSALKESDDLRAPLAFLLGRLDFEKLFGEVRREGEEIVAIPKTANAPYREVRFVASSNGSVERVIVRGQDASVMEFRFFDQRRNIPVDEMLFRFTPPPGVEVVAAQDGQ